MYYFHSLSLYGNQLTEIMIDGFTSALLHNIVRTMVGRDHKHECLSDEDLQFAFLKLKHSDLQFDCGMILTQFVPLYYLMTSVSPRVQDMHHHTKNEVSMSKRSQVAALTNRA